jgi:hypothetical protein
MERARVPLIWCSISSHGFGHAAQMVPVLNALGQRIPGLRAVLRTMVPAAFFEGRLDIPWEISAEPQDIGCIQDGPLNIDVAATWTEHERFHQGWKNTVSQEAGTIRSRSPRVVLSSISHLAIEAAVQAGVPAVGLCSLSWDQVLEPFVSPDEQARIRQDQVLRRIRTAYAGADLIVRPTPGLPMPAFKEVRDVGPIAQSTRPDPSALRQKLGAAPEDCIVLVAFGGIPLRSLPLIELERMSPFWFILDTAKEAVGARVRLPSSLPFSFNSLLASADIIMTKPGYSTVIEAVAHARPVVYVRRYNFADEADLVRYLQTYGRAVELPATDFTAGRWRQAFETVLSLPRPLQNPPAATGASQAAEILAGYF